MQSINISVEKPSKREIVRNKSVKNENNISDHKIISKVNIWKVYLINRLRFKFVIY